MTPQERAEKIVQKVLTGIEGSYFEYFLAQIEEAQKEALMGLHGTNMICWEKGWRAAKEKAKGIFKRGALWSNAKLEKEIGKMEPGE